MENNPGGAGFKIKYWCSVVKITIADLLGKEVMQVAKRNLFCKDVGKWRAASTEGYNQQIKP
ncbi:MAG: hypothetical protein H0W84_06315 [Bacteroidetes bacterium]|nr:hypothetical protein [Bacteroidota bacterium]